MNWLKDKGETKTETWKWWRLALLTQGEISWQAKMLCRDSLRPLWPSGKDRQPSLLYSIGSLPCSPGLEADWAVEAPGADSAPGTHQMQCLLLLHAYSASTETSITQRNAIPTLNSCLPRTSKHKESHLWLLSWRAVYDALLLCILF